MKKVKGCEVYFSGTFSLTSPLSDRKVPTKLQGGRSWGETGRGRGAFTMF